MHIGEICTLQAINCTRDETVQGAAMLMRRHHVGDLLAFLAEEMSELSRIGSWQQAHERRERQ